MAPRYRVAEVARVQICWNLWNSRWNRTGEYRRPKILFLADRNILVDDPMAKMFAPFGDARQKIAGRDVSHGREMYFGIYQALSTASEDVYRQYRPDFFDLIVIDECHRGSSRDTSSWRAVLDYFAPAVQFGMTATPLREESRDTYDYFGNPVCTYSLRQGIEDGFLAPYLRHYFLSDEGMLKIREASPGGAGRNRTLGLERLMAIEVPIPPLSVQRSFERIQSQVNELKARHAEIRKANAALLPATLERIFAAG